MAVVNGYQASQYTGHVTTPTGNITPIPYEIGVTAGLVPGHSKVAGLGYSPSVSSSISDIWAGSSGSTTYPFLTSASTLQIVSDSASDAAAGTGARTVTLTLLDINFNQYTVTVTMNGTTPVTVPGGQYFRVNQMIVATAGSTLQNVGNISLQTSGGATTIGYILAATGVAQSSVYTAPAGSTLYLTKIAISIDEPLSGNYVSIGAMVQTPNALLIQRFQISVSDIASFELDVPLPVVVQSGQDFFLRSLIASGTSPVTAIWQGVQVVNSVLS